MIYDTVYTMFNLEGFEDTKGETRIRKSKKDIHIWNGITMFQFIFWEQIYTYMIRYSNVSVYFLRAYVYLYIYDTVYTMFQYTRWYSCRFMLKLLRQLYVIYWYYIKSSFNFNLSELSKFKFINLFIYLYWNIDH